MPADDVPSMGFIVMGHRVSRDHAWEKSAGDLQGVQRLLFLRMSSRGRLYVEWALDQGFIPPWSITEMKPEPTPVES